MPLIEQDPQEIRFYTDYVEIRFPDTQNSDKIINKILGKVQDGINATPYIVEGYLIVIVVRDRLICDAETIYVFIDDIKAIIITNLLNALPQI